MPGPERGSLPAALVRQGPLDCLQRGSEPERWHNTPGAPARATGGHWTRAQAPGLHGHCIGLLGCCEHRGLLLGRRARAGVGESALPARMTPGFPVGAVGPGQAANGSIGRTGGAL